MNSHSRGRVAIVGAGPGDPDLLTVKAWRCLQQADVVAYDELVPREIFGLAPPRAMLIAVGRRDGFGTTPWPIHPKVIEFARAGLLVVRLKCGDPMIFGRGGEEAEALAEAGIPFELVPGITAAMGVGSLGFSLTHRDHASSVTFATGHDALGEQASHCRWDALVRAGGTLVIYMGGKRLEANAARLIGSGMPAETPAACVVAATRPEQQIVTGTLDSIGEGTRGIDVCQPILMIVGSIVAQRDRVMRLMAGQRESLENAGRQTGTNS